MKIIDNFISLDEIKRIKTFYQDRPFDITQDGARCDLSTVASWILEEILFDKILNLFGPGEIESQGEVFQRFYFAPGLHTDSKKKVNADVMRLETSSKFVYQYQVYTPSGWTHNTIATQFQHEGKALLIPLGEGPGLSTIFWKEKYSEIIDYSALLEEFNQLLPSQVRNSRISERYDLRHNTVYIPLCDHLTLDGVFDWQLGSAVMWDRNQLHSATYFNDHCKFKDSIVIMFN